MSQDEEILRNLYNNFDPFRPLPAGDPLYVDCREVRGDGDILVELGKNIRRTNRITCQLYSGHRGAGKSTELLRLKQYLEEQKFFVVYFAADEQDVNPQDTQYTDILLACTRHLLEDLKDSANPSPVLNWLKSRWVELKDLALTEISFESLSVESQISQFAKLTANLRAVPTLRQQIRNQVNPHTETLIKALNQFINDAKNQLPQGCTQLAVIADNLDRIVLSIQDGGRSNHDEIFIDRSEQLQALDCHLIYTLPISMPYSSRAVELRNIYDDMQVLPMIMVQQKSGDIYQPGMDKITEIIEKRVRQCVPNRAVDGEVFDSKATIERLCLMSGGHVRNLLLLIQDAISRTETLPISAKAVQRSITEARDAYRRTVENYQWEILAQVAKTKRIRNEDDCRNLLFNRCLLEYRYFDDEGEIQCWCDVHPLIKGIQEFKEAVANMQP
ncbi:MAG TPA: pilus assembly protein PilB [Cyanobacteria bacterium UBA11372]|nr:pilus assembly protein PilB [Cyanobacteria bacterium UBA11372]